MGDGHKRHVGAEVVEFWLSKDYKKTNGHVLSTTLCF